MFIPQATAPYDALTAQVRNQLFQTASSYLNQEELELLEKSCAYAFVAHDGQFRDSGEPYITHPITVTIELATWRMDVQTLCAGLMHDVLEDTAVDKNMMIAEFGNTIADMVDGLSKLEKLKFDNASEHKAESFRKLILAMTKDVRVIIVKLSDRLHNMKTLGGMRPDKKRRIAKETLEIYAPIANRLGLNHVYRELQDLSFQNIHPKRYQILQKAMRNFHRQNRDIISKVLSAISLELTKNNLEAQVKGREKNLYSIHQKMINKKLKFDEVMDIYGFRIIVKSRAECYMALGVLHGLYQPKFGKFKDFIAIPKSNGYQSLHTTLTGPSNTPIEVQIRTRDMDKTAEEGIASHWAYKTGERHLDQASLHANQWLKNLIELQARSASAAEFLEHVKIDLFPNEVYIFTPKGRIITLPEGATPIDFAYNVHTDIGNRTMSARVNGNLAPLRSKLKNGDTVEIITSEQARPNVAWLNFAVSSRARSALRNYFKNINRQDAEDLGKNLLHKALSALLPQDVLMSQELSDAYEAYLKANDTTFENLLCNVGMGHIQPVSVAMQLAQLAGKHFGGEVKLSPININSGETGRLRIAPCCSPVHGDAVRAVLVKDQGIVIHRDNCANLLKTSPEQQLDANWDGISHHSYQTTLVISAKDSHALLAALTSTISNEGADIRAIDTPSQHQSGSEGFIEFRIQLRIQDTHQLSRIFHALHHIPQVISIIRL